MSLNIKDPEVHRLAKELASRRRTTATGAVREALQEALERTDPAGSRAGVAQRLMELARRGGRVEGRGLRDDELYDERGLPR